MVKAVQGYLLTCDIPLKEYIRSLNEAASEKFVIEELDDNHLLITLQSVESVKQKVREWQNSVHYEAKKEG